MKKCFILIFSTVFSLPIEAQNNGAAPGVPVYRFGNDFSWASQNNNPNRAQSNTDTIVSESIARELDERFFGGNEFREGELRTRKGLLTTELSYRFDQLAGTVEVKKQDGTTLLLDEKEILYCKIYYGKDVHTFMPVALPNEKNLTLLHVIYKTPTLQLYRHIRKIVKPQRDTYQYANPGANTELTLGLRNDYRYFIRKSDKTPLQEVSIAAKSFIKALPEKEKTITRLFKESKVRGNLTVSAICKMMGKLDKKAEAE
jgi:hypothetical protein